VVVVVVTEKHKKHGKVAEERQREVATGGLKGS
jgi:hypothetical protein